MRMEREKVTQKTGEDPTEGWPRDPARQGLRGRAERRQSPQAAGLGQRRAQRRSLPALLPAGEWGGGRRDARGEVPSKRSCVWQVPRFVPGVHFLPRLPGPGPSPLQRTLQKVTPVKECGLAPFPPISFPK